MVLLKKKDLLAETLSDPSRILTVKSTKIRINLKYFFAPLHRSSIHSADTQSDGGGW